MFGRGADRCAAESDADNFDCYGPRRCRLADSRLEGDGFEPIGIRKINYRFETDFCHLRDGFASGSRTGFIFFATGNPGTGYYTAIMAHLVGPSGKVTGIELDPGLAERARDNLSSYPDVDVVCGNGAVVPFETADVYADRPRSWFTETPNMPNPS